MHETEAKDPFIRCGLCGAPPDSETTVGSRCPCGGPFLFQPCGACEFDQEGYCVRCGIARELFGDCVSCGAAAVDPDEEDALCLECGYPNPK